jgi:hypothetical protein
MTYISQVWVPALIGGRSPKEALDCIRELIHVMPAAEHRQFEYITDYLKATCRKLGGISTQRDASKMVVPFANPGRTPALQGWASRQLTIFYPHLGGGPMHAPGPDRPAMGFTAFGDNLARGLTAGMTTAAQGFAALMPLPAAKTKDDWTPLQKRMIAKVIDKAEDADFEAVAPAIWTEFVAEGKTAEDIQRVLQENFRLDSNDPDADDVSPVISRQTAKDIKACRFVPTVLTVETCIQGVMPIALCPRSEMEQYMDALTEDDEDKATLVTADHLQSRRAKASKRQKRRRLFTDSSTC